MQITFDMLPTMVQTPKMWYRDTEEHSSHIEQALYAGLAHSLPVAPFLAITAHAFDAFCLLHKLSILDREHSFPLGGSAKAQLVNRCKRLSLPDEFVEHIHRYYQAVLGKNEVFVWSSQPAVAVAAQPKVFVGEVSALAAVRETWANLVSERGVSQTRTLLHKHPLYLMSQPKQAFTGELRLKDKLIAECVIKHTRGEVEQSYFINLSTGEVGSQPISLDHPAPKSALLNQVALGNLARALYRKSLYTLECPIAGTKAALWIQPNRFHATSKVDATQHSAPGTQVLAKGESRGKGIVVGQVIIVKHERDWRKVHAHHIVVTSLSITKPSSISLHMRALVSQRASLGALVANHLRELRFPVVTGVAHITKLVKNGQVISVDASKGTLYVGNPFASQKITELLPLTHEPTKFKHTSAPTRVFARVPRIPLIDNPRQASATVTDLSEEKRVLLSWGSSIIKELGVHPKRLWQDKQGAKISRFIESSLSAIKRQSPHTTVMYALSDFDLAALARLKFSPAHRTSTTASYFGLRGAGNLLVDAADFSHVEIAALAQAHAKRMSLEVVVPFCRTPLEFIAVKRFLARYHLIRGGYVKLYIRLETPAQLSQLDAFSDAGIDGIVLDMQRLSLLYSGINASLADHAPLKHSIYQELAQFINQSLVGLPVKLPVYAWYTDYDIAYASELYPKRINGFIA